MRRVMKKEDYTNEDLSINLAATELPLEEGRDYYLERGYLVFTASYLRRRGYCCEQGCRHCPYTAADGEDRGGGPRPKFQP
jgi:hypothetical protein